MIGRSLKMASIATVPMMFMMLTCYNAASATLTAATSLTIVHVTSYLNQRTPPSITTWEGDWPQSPDAQYLAPNGYEMYVLNPTMTHHSINWQTIPSYTPYPLFPNGLNSMICNVYVNSPSRTTYELGSWDYLAPYAKGKGLEEGMPDCWMGTMVHSYCEFEAGKCNGRYKSNLMFSVYPTGNTSCWGMEVMNN